MVYVDIPTTSCFDEEMDGEWQNVRNFDSIADAVKFLRFHLGDAQVSDEGYVRLITGEDMPSCEACGGVGFLPNCERCDTCGFFESDEAAREHIYGMAMRHHRPFAQPEMLDLSSLG